MATKEAAGVRGPGGQRTRIPHGNMRAKLLDYIGQVFECKADDTYYIRKDSSRTGGARHVKREAQLVYFVYLICLLE
jgi:hypothetical protein